MEVKDQPRSIRSLIDEFRYATNAEYAKVYGAYLIIKSMIEDDKCCKFITFPESIAYEYVTLRALLSLLKKKHIDAIMTTGPSIDIDLLRAFDICSISETPRLLGASSDTYNSLASKLNPIFEKFFEGAEDEDDKKNFGITSTQLLNFIGKFTDSDNSFVSCSYKSNIPIFVPDISIGAFFFTLSNYIEAHKNEWRKHYLFDVLADETKLSDLMFGSEAMGGIILVGGIAKHHLQWWSSYRGGLDYGVQITETTEFNGSLSGARMKESVTWGQLKASGKWVSLYGDPIVLFPMLIYSIYETR